MVTREADLPGVGTKYSFPLTSGEQLVAVRHRVGHWEIARVDDEGQTTPLVTLAPKEAAELGRILSQRQEAEADARKQMLFEEFSMEWVTLDADSPLVGQTLRDAGVRARTGASVIAVLRSDSSIPSPPPDTSFLAGDTLVIIGGRNQVDRFIREYSSIAIDT